MKWTEETIKELRLSLGWSVAEFSRRFGVTSSVVHNWEAGQAEPTVDDLRQLDFLSFHLKNYSDSITAQPKADALILNHNFDQVHRDVTQKD